MKTKKLIFLSASLFVAFSGEAQLKYENNALTFNGYQYGGAAAPSTTTWHGSKHSWIYSTNGLTSHLSMDARYYPANIIGQYFGSSTGEIWFSHPATSNTFNDLWASNYYSTSDRSFKTNIRPLHSAIQTILALKPVTYQWIDQGNMRASKYSPLVSNPQEIGFIAQDVEQVLPDIIRIDGPGNRFLNYNALIPILTGAIQELNARIEVLEQQLKAK